MNNRPVEHRNWKRLLEGRTPKRLDPTKRAALLEQTVGLVRQRALRRIWWWRLAPLGSLAAALIIFMVWPVQSPEGPPLVPPHPSPLVGEEGKGGRLTLGLTPFDGGTVYIPKGTTASLKKDGNRQRIFLEVGTLEVGVVKGQGQVEVVTPAGRAVAWGTHYRVSVTGGSTMTKKTVKKAMQVLVFSGVVQLTNALGGVALVAGEAGTSTVGSAPTKNVEELASRFAKYYQPVPLRLAANPQIPAYDLPLKPEQIQNWTVAQQLGVDPDRLLKHGFVVKPWGTVEHIEEPYKKFKEMNIPIFVTGDTVLHLYHIQFDQTLMDIEEREFIPDLKALSRSLQEWALAGEKKAQDPIVKAAYRKLTGFFAVGAKLQDDQVDVPDTVQADVAKELQLIEKHQGFAESPLFAYKEDYSQYVPRGHYTKSEDLKRYFKAMMWYGRLVFLAKGKDVDPKALITGEEAKIQTIAAALLTNIMPTLKVDKRIARAVWDRLYTVTAYYVGVADDLGFDDYVQCMETQLGKITDPAELVKPDKLLAFRWELAKRRSPAIYSGTGKQVGPPVGAPNPQDLAKALDNSKGLRFMGQRFIPDSYMMGTLVYPTIGHPEGAGPQQFTWVPTDGGPIRGFPRGLDVMTVLGSKRAQTILKDLQDDGYKGYGAAAAKLRDEFSGFGEAEWNRNLYWSWLYSLQALLQPVGNGYPTFMATEPYATKKMTSALASWSQLRHDTILYAKQSYTKKAESAHVGPREFRVEGYVEPLPVFYSRLLALARMSTKGLSDMQVLDKAATNRLTQFETLLTRLLDISERELANQALTPDDYAWIRNFADQIVGLMVSLKPGSRETYDPNKTTIIADVHTDQNTRQCLEEGTGYVELMLAAYRMPQGHIVLGAGPVLSYYEFKQPMSDRLTDEKWREVLKRQPPAPPSWTEMYRQK